MKYEYPAAFRTALLARMRNLAERTEVPTEQVRKRVVFERLLGRLLKVAPDRWALKGGMALDFRMQVRARPTKDADLLGPKGLEQATEDLLAAQRVDLGDYFVFVIFRAAEEGEHPEPTVSFHVRTEVGGLLFDEARIDVEFAKTTRWRTQVVTSALLAFAGIDPVKIPVILLETQVAEKLHAYTRSYGREGQASTRPRDLLDMLLIVHQAELDVRTLRMALDDVFARRATHPLPARLPAAPTGWAVPFRAAAVRIGLTPDDVDAAHKEVAACLDPVLEGTAVGRWNPVTRRWEAPSTGSDPPHG